MAPHRFRVRPCRCSMLNALDGHRHRTAHTNHAREKPSTRRKSLEETTFRTMAAEPNYKFQIGLTVRCEESVVLCTHKPNPIVAAVPFLLFILLFIYFVRLHSDRNLMIFKNAHTIEMKCIFRVPPPRIIPCRWILLCVTALERNNKPNKAFMPNEIFRLTLCVAGAWLSRMSRAATTAAACVWKSCARHI